MVPFIRLLNTDRMGHLRAIEERECLKLSPVFTTVSVFIKDISFSRMYSIQYYLGVWGKMLFSV